MLLSRPDSAPLTPSQRHQVSVLATQAQAYLDSIRAKPKPKVLHFGGLDIFWDLVRTRMNDVWLVQTRPDHVSRAFHQWSKEQPHMSFRDWHRIYPQAVPNHDRCNFCY